MSRIYNVTSAREHLYKLVNDVQRDSLPVIITGKEGNAVLVSQQDWDAIQETLYLTSIPGMKESLLAGMAESLDEGATLEEIGWDID